MEDYKSISQLYKEDETLKQLFDQQEKLEALIKKRKIQIAHNRHIVADSLQGLTCNDHDNKLEISGLVEGSATIIEWKNYSTDKKAFNTYACSESSEKVEAYDCPECGIVLGLYHVETYRIRSKSLKQKGAAAGYFIRCSVCDTLIGYGAQSAFGKVDLT